MAVSRRAFCSSSCGARQVGSGGEMSTNRPRTRGSQRAVSAAALGSPRGTANTGPSTIPPGLQASSSASSVCTRGEVRSTCSTPWRQPRQVPYCSLRTVTPQLR
jgi:hypothetical protein